MDQRTNATGVERPPPPDIRIFAFGRKGYAFAAANLAASIKRWSPEVKIILHAESRWLDHYRDHHRDYFDGIIELQEKDYTSIGRLDPGRLKSRLYDHLPAGDHLYLDADCLCLKDIKPLLVALQKDGRNYIAEVVSKGTAESGQIEYCPWASPAKQGQKLPAGSIVYGLQTSWAFIRKVPDDGAFFARVKHNHDRTWRKEELDHKWGDSMPDELVYGFTCSELGHDPSWPREVMFYGNKLIADTIDDIRFTSYFMTQYGRIGRGGSVRPHYLDMYDKEMVRIFNYFGQKHIFHLNMIGPDKYVDAYKLHD